MRSAAASCAPFHSKITDCTGLYSVQAGGCVCIVRRSRLFRLPCLLRAPAGHPTALPTPPEASHRICFSSRVPALSLPLSYRRVRGSSADQSCEVVPKGARAYLKLPYLCGLSHPPCTLPAPAGPPFTSSSSQQGERRCRHGAALEMLRRRLSENVYVASELATLFVDGAVSC